MKLPGNELTWARRGNIGAYKSILTIPNPSWRPYLLLIALNAIKSRVPPQTFCNKGMFLDTSLPSPKPLSLSPTNKFAANLMVHSH